MAAQVYLRQKLQLYESCCLYRESDTWQCLLCINFADLPDESFGEKKDGELSAREKKILERIVLELYCQYELSLPFREVLGPEVSRVLFFFCKFYH